MVMGLLRVKGQHFDVDGETPLTELLQMDGLFVLKDIQNRLPVSKRRLSKMVYDKGKFSNCFVLLYKDRRNRGVLHVDLRRLNELLCAQAQEPLKWRAEGQQTQLPWGRDGQ